MKERYNVEISDIHLTIISDEPEEFVNSTVEKISERVNDLIVHNKRCSKLDAALLCALDYCGELAKAERRIRNLEAQISLYDANLKRMREELAAKGDTPDSVKSALGIADEIKATDAEKATKKGAHDKSEDAAKHYPKATVKSDSKPDVETVNMLDDSAKNSAAPAEAKKDAPADAPASSTKSKLEQIEMLLRKSND